ncbi:kinase-like protein [Gloeophyllum trabeum ATCC 11539]|uniref:Kinase-like protein n=1 Tax=Gloeophyllum trabeum (strain ATCC 11539 / FP-39264 / Madison 617) TaxID=670483 RepID=S7Q616_GLOTA|nr:kinase-like protein [Gloeophyllum trabeum ATCC 11539]EPQ54922.1 kinase-like protein [Gloeophyllum trabeum ATCC 11539]
MDADGWAGQLVRREALVWRQLRHPFVLPFLGIDLESFDQVSLVSPWMANGNIRDYRGSQALTAQDIHRLLQEVALGLQYLHNQNVVHGDLRGGNILIDADHKVRLADFGLSVLAEATRGAYTSARQTGSVRWLAPELADPHAATWRKTRASDVWAFGCVCLEVCTERSPYAYVPHDALALLAIVAGRAPAERPDALGMSAALWEMCLRCWAPDPAQRLGSGDLVMEMGKVRFWRGWGGSGSDGVGAGR